MPSLPATWRSVILVNRVRASATGMLPRPSMSSTARATAAEVRSTRLVYVFVGKTCAQKSAVLCMASVKVWQRISSHGAPSDDSPFFDNDMPTMRSSSSSSEGLPRVIGLNWEGSVESNEVNDELRHPSFWSWSPDVMEVFQWLVSVPTRTRTSAKRAALAESARAITQNARVAMEATMQLTHTVVSVTVGWGHMLSLPPPTLAQRCVRHFDISLIWSLTIFGSWVALKSSLPAGSGRVFGTDRLLQVPPFTCGGRHWPANISHPDWKWPQRNRHHVRGFRPHIHINPAHSFALPQYEMQNSSLLSQIVWTQA